MQLSDTITIRIFDIDWDTEVDDNRSEIPELPEEVDAEFTGYDLEEHFDYNEDEDDYTLRTDYLDEDLSNWLSDKYGFCVNGFQWEIVEEVE